MKEDKRAGIFPEGICFELPELYAVKVARTVLKGESGGNAADLLNQNKSQKNFKERALFYLSHAVTRQGQTGDFWNFDVKAVYGVFFMNFLIKGNIKFRTDVILADRETGEQFTDKMRQVFLSLPVFKKEEEASIIAMNTGLSPEEIEAL